MELMENMEHYHSIHLYNVAVRQQTHLVLQNINLSIEKGSFVVLTGAVGSGKSSLLHTLYAELPLASGEGMVAGFNLNSLSEKYIPLLRRKIGIVFQEFKLLNDRSVYGNLAFVLHATEWKKKEQIRQRITEVLSITNMLHSEKRMPYELSGGEQQQIMIARAILNDPEIIIADEPTGNLDETSTHKLLELLLKQHEMGKTILLATHDMLLIKHLPRARRFHIENQSVVELRKQRPPSS